MGSVQLGWFIGGWLKDNNRGAISSQFGKREADCVISDMDHGVSWMPLEKWRQFDHGGGA